MTSLGPREPGPEETAAARGAAHLLVLLRVKDEHRAAEHGHDRAGDLTARDWLLRRDRVDDQHHRRHCKTPHKGKVLDEDTGLTWTEGGTSARLRRRARRAGLWW